MANPKQLPKEHPLKPIGTVYQEEFPPDKTSTNPCPHRVTWEVVDHVECQDGYGRQFMAEKLAMIKREELPPPSFIKSQ